MKNIIVYIFIINSIVAFGQQTDSLSTNDSIPSLDLSDFIDTTNFFPGRGSFGIELTPTYEVEGKFRMEYGINFIHTSWVNLTGNYNSTTGNLANKNWGLQQFGTSISFCKAVNPYGDGPPEIWATKFGILYNRINVPFYSLGVTARVNAVAYFPPTADNQEIPSFLNLENIHFQPAIGITWTSIFNIYYTRNIDINDGANTIMPNHSIKFTLNINASFFKFGLQGM